MTSANPWRLAKRRLIAAQVGWMLNRLAKQETSVDRAVIYRELRTRLMHDRGPVSELNLALTKVLLNDETVRKQFMGNVVRDQLLQDETASRDGNGFGSEVAERLLLKIAANALLPDADRWLEEWRGELNLLPLSDRHRFVQSLLVRGIPRLAVTTRLAWLRRGTR